MFTITELHRLSKECQDTEKTFETSYSEFYEGISSFSAIEEKPIRALCTEIKKY